MKKAAKKKSVTNPHLCKARDTGKNFLPARTCSNGPRPTPVSSPASSRARRDVTNRAQQK